MKTNKRLNKLRSVRFFTGQLPIFIFFILLFLNLNILKNITFANGIILFYLLFSATLSNYFFTEEIRKEKAKENLASNQLFSQLIFIVIFISLGITCFYRFFCIENLVFYQKILTSLVGIISIIFTLLLIWGIKYIDKSG